jgi:hypothetical protein
MRRRVVCPRSHPASLYVRGHSDRSRGFAVLPQGTPPGPPIEAGAGLARHADNPPTPTIEARAGPAQSADTRTATQTRAACANGTNTASRQASGCVTLLPPSARASRRKAGRRIRQIATRSRAWAELVSLHGRSHDTNFTHSPPWKAICPSSVRAGGRRGPTAGAGPARRGPVQNLVVDRDAKRGRRGSRGLPFLTAARGPADPARRGSDFVPAIPSC